MEGNFLEIYGEMSLIACINGSVIIIIIIITR